MARIGKFDLEPGVHVQVYEEEDPDWSWAEEKGSEDAALMRKVRRGDVQQVFVVVTVFDASGEVEGSDSLGGIVTGLDDHKQEIRDAIDAHDMVSEARKDLAEKLTRIKAAL